MRDGHPLQAKSLNNSFREVSNKKWNIDYASHLATFVCYGDAKRPLCGWNTKSGESASTLKLGHSSIVTTKMIYGDISPEDEAKEADSNAVLLRRLETYD